MKHYWTYLVLAVCATVLPAQSIGEGTYSGKYKGATESATGDIRITFSKSAEGRWVTESSFTVQGQDVKCKTTEVSVTEAKLKHVCVWEAQGYVLETTLNGEASGGKLEGAYVTMLKSEGTRVDEGTWSASTASR